MTKLIKYSFKVVNAIVLMDILSKTINAKFVTKIVKHAMSYIYLNLFIFIIAKIKKIV